MGIAGHLPDVGPTAQAAKLTRWTRAAAATLAAMRSRGGADGRNAVFYGDGAIDRPPCGTGTSARLAQLVMQGKLNVGERFVHESYIGSTFIGRVESAAIVGDRVDIIPSIEGTAIATGFNTIWIDRADRFWDGFQVR